ncbi:hypothetical protein H2201_003341 [Coniosporium apollinis]|uniref:BTB domain-containing protein n=1 Tax=Coniosporium apollinis TaxID=61459 RepID=A0ABQ9NVJ1_9PEZI|nr:hypothetical protein H2201_003341 [Coniosporium apollinis]
MPLPYGLQMGYITLTFPLPTANGTEVTVTIIHVFLRCFEMLPLAYTGATPAETALAAMVDCYFMARLCGLEEFRLAMLEGITEDLSRCSSIAVIEYVYDYVPEDWQLRRAVVMAVMERTEGGVYFDEDEMEEWSFLVPRFVRDLREWEYVYGG